MKTIIAGLPCLLTLYILSFGALAKSDDCGFVGESGNKILRVAYAPLGLLGLIPGSARMFDWYIFDFWKCDPMTTR